MADRAALEDAIARHGLSDARDVILGAAEACWHIVPDAVGRTRLGGLPDLPDGVGWPRAEGGAWANFFGQLDLADVTARTGAALPRAGLLSLFVTSLGSAGDPVRVVALATPADTPVVTQEQPCEEDELADPYTGFLDPVGARFVPALSLPTDSGRFIDAIEARTGQRDLFDFFGALKPERGTVGQLLGHAAPPDGDELSMMLTLHRHGHGLMAQHADVADWDSYAAIYPGMDREDAASARAEVAWMIEHRDEMRAEAAEWRLLLRIDSNRAMRLNINDADPIYFFIRAAELARGDFSRVEAAVTQG